MTNKYHNTPTMVNGFAFASKKEATRYQELQVLERAGKIRNLILQPSYPIIVNGKRIAVYYADFRYTEIESGKSLVEDVKCAVTKTQVYRIKKKLVKAIYNIDIQEI